MTTATHSVPTRRRTWRSKARHKISNGRFYAVLITIVLVSQTVSDTAVKIAELMAR